MNIADEIWNRLAKSKKYREEFALSLLKRSVAFQIKTLRKKRCGSQAVLAEHAKLTQGVVSRAEDQDYGNLTFNTVGRIAGGLDMAFIGKFVPFSALVRYSLELSEAQFENIPTFDEEKPDLPLSFGVFGATVCGAAEVNSEQQSEPEIVEGSLVKALASFTASAERARVVDGTLAAVNVAARVALCTMKESAGASGISSNRFASETAENRSILSAIKDQNSIAVPLVSRAIPQAQDQVQKQNAA